MKRQENDAAYLGYESGSLEDANIRIRGVRSNGDERISSSKVHRPSQALDIVQQTRFNQFERSSLRQRVSLSQCVFLVKSFVTSTPAFGCPPLKGHATSPTVLGEERKDDISEVDGAKRRIEFQLSDRAEFDF